MTEELQSLSEIKSYRVKSGCSENKCDYSQLFINLLKKSEYKNNLFFLSQNDYDSVVHDFSKVFDLYDKDLVKKTIKQEKTSYIIDISLIHNREITTKIAAYFLCMKQIDDLSSDELLFFLHFLNFDNCHKMMAYGDFQTLIDKLFPFCVDYLNNNQLLKEITKETLINYVHSLYETELTRKKILSYDLSNPKSIYTSIFRIDDFDSFIITKGSLDDTNDCLTFIVRSCYFVEDGIEQIVSLLDYAKDNSFVLFFLLLEHIRNLNPSILSRLLDNPDYGAISLNLIGDYLTRMLSNAKELRITENFLIEIYKAAIEKFIFNLDRVIPRKGKFDVVSDISFILCSAIEYHNKNKGNVVTNNFQIETIRLIKDAIVNAFVKHGYFKRDNLLPLANDLLNAPADYFSEITELGYTVKLFDYFSKTKIQEEILTEYSLKINKIFISVLQDKHFYASIFDSIEFSNYFSFFNYSKTFLVTILTVKNDDCNLFYHYRNICLLKILYTFYKTNVKTFKDNEYLNFSAELIRLSFLPEPNGYTRTLDLIIDEKGIYKNYAIELLDFLCECSKKYEIVFQNIINDVPYKLKFFIFNTSKNPTVQTLLEEYLTNVKINDVLADINYLPDLIKFTIDVYNSHLNEKLASDLLNKLHTFINSRFSETKEYKTLLVELDMFDAYINEDEKRLDSHNVSNYENELRMYYKSLIHFKNKDYEFSLKYMEALVEKYPNKSDYKILLLQTQQALGNRIQLEQIEELIKVEQESENKDERLASLFEMKAVQLFNDNKIDDLYEFYLKNRKLFIEYGIAQEQVIKMLCNKQDDFQISYYLSRFDNPFEIQRIVNSYKIPEAIIINNLRNNNNLYKALKDCHKIRVIPEAINENHGDIGIFIKNVLEKSLNQLVTKCNTINSLAPDGTLAVLKENQINDLLQSLINNYFYPLDLKESKDQPRVGNSYRKDGDSKDAGSADIVLKIDDEDVIVEGLWMDSLNKKNLDIHINKSFDYSTYGKNYFVVIYYGGSNYPLFKNKIFDYLNNSENTIKTGNKHQYVEKHMLQQIEQITNNNNLNTIKLILEDSVMYVLNVNMKNTSGNG